MIQIPIVHLNGTGGKSLIEQLEKPIETLRLALRELEEAAPHGRDYYLRPSTYEVARDEHLARVRRITDVRNELRLVASGVQDQMSRRGR